MGRIGVFLALILLVVVVSNVEGGRGGGRGGSRSSSSRRSYSSSSSSRSRSNNGGPRGSRDDFGTYRGNKYGGKKKKSGIKSKLKKAAIVGVGVWAGYKVAKATSKFAAWSIGGVRPNWGFGDWNRWRQAEGMLCRNDNDCRWLDQNFQCADYELTFTPSSLWFGGDFAKIRGQCECRDGWDWADRDFRCEEQVFLPWVVALIVIAVLSSFCCCCVGVACWFCRK